MAESTRRLAAEAANPAVWTTAAWREEATAWLDEALAAAGTPRTGAVEQTRVRPWGTVLRAPTAAGAVWMKACAAATAFEAPLYELLHGQAPDRVLRPLAVDAVRGWVALPDGGSALADDAQGADQVPGLLRAMAPYAELQLALTPRVPELLALGVVDNRPAALPARFDEALAATAEHAHRPGGGDDAAAHDAVAAMRSRVGEWAAELGASAVAPTLDHNDLHSGNVLLSSGQPRFYDWGDSVVAHPFVSMLTTITFVRDHLLGGAADDDPRLTGLRDAYLEPFAAHHGVAVAELVPTLELACRLGKITRTLTWHRAIESDPDAPATWRAAPLATLRSLLDPSPYGSA